MTTSSHVAGTVRRSVPLAVAWFVGVPIGAFVGWLAGISDDADDRRYGGLLLALAAVGLIVALTVLLRPSPAVRTLSLVTSAGWAVAAAVAVVAADFPADRAWGGGLLGGVAAVTGLLALRWRVSSARSATR